MFKVEADNLGVDRKWRVVQHDAPLRVLGKVLIVSTGKERTDDFPASKGRDLFVHEITHDLVHLRGCVAIVRGERLFFIEFVHELVVPFAALPSFRG